MSDVKWIKLSTQMFEDEKIKLIEQMPEADTLLIIWIKLLSQAGRNNDHGYIYLSENIPYTDEMLSTIFGRSLNVVRMALSVFKQFGMIEVTDNDIISICNWDKHQNTIGLEKIREQNRLRKQRERDRKRLELPSPEHGHVTVTQGHAIDIDKELELDIEEDKDKDIEKEKEKENSANASSLYEEIIKYLNQKANTNFRSTSKETQKLIKARLNDKFTAEDFKAVIDIKTEQWLNDKKFCIYLRPKTLFGNNFESYLNEKRGKNNATHGRNIGEPQGTSETILRGRTGWIKPDNS